MSRAMMKMCTLVILIGLIVSGCASSGGGRRTLETALSAPPGTLPAAAAANEEGIKLFYSRQWEPAREKFEAAIKAQPTFAQAHYNLGLVYDAQRNDREARKHFVEAANLAPGDKEIWNSPMLRSHGQVQSTTPKSGSVFSGAEHSH